MSVVSYQPCPDYDPQHVQQAVRRCLDGLGGLDKIVRPGHRVLCKANLLMPALPERAITTHPEVLRAVIREIKRVGGVPVLGDNPAATGLRATASRGGLLQVAREEGVELADMLPTATLKATGSHGYSSFAVSRAVLEADVLFNLPKLKTHALTYMTLAMKNFYGLIPGLEKSRWHLAAPNPEAFSNLIVHLFQAVDAHFQPPKRMVHLLDGVLAMEGDGPGAGGTPRQVGLLLASTDAVALDRLACHLVGLDPDKLLTVKLAHEKGLGEGRLEAIQVVGDPPQAPLVEAFAPPKGADFALTVVHRFAASPFFRRRMLERPEVMADTCIGCGRCVEICASQAIHLEDRPGSGSKKLAVMDHDRCIRCYCCAEICPVAAIEKSDPPLLGRLFGSPRALMVGGGIAAVLLLVAIAAVVSALLR